MAGSRNEIGTLNSLTKGFIRNTIKQFAEYEQIKKGEHSGYSTVTAFFEAKNITKSNFFKLYNRYKQENNEIEVILPQKRGPKYGNRKFMGEIEEEAIKLRKQGFNRLEVYASLQIKYKELAPSVSSVYTIFKRYNLNRLNMNKAEVVKERIETSRIGELGHIDCHYLPQSMVAGGKRRYLVGIIDDASRLMWATVVPDLTSMRVSFGAMRCMNALQERYGIKFEKMMSDNGGEFGSGKKANNKNTNPFKIMLEELGIEQVHIKPYRPQTNGKIERIWRTMDEELIDADWDSFEEFELELLKYILYYNEHRIHQGIGTTPLLKKQAICS